MGRLSKRTVEDKSELKMKGNKEPFLSVHEQLQKQYFRNSIECYQKTESKIYSRKRVKTEGRKLRELSDNPNKERGTKELAVLAHIRNHTVGTEKLLKR